MTTENNPNNQPPIPTDEELNQQPQEEEKVEDQEVPEEADPDSPFAPYQDLRRELMAEGVDMKALDEKFFNEEEISDEELAPIAAKKGVTVEDVRTFLSISRHAVKAQVAQQERYVAELNEVSGGSYEELLGFIGEAAAQDESLGRRVKIWNAALATKDPETQKDVLREMQEFRLSKTPAARHPNAKPANLNLLTKANATATKPPAQAPVNNSLDGNPLAGMDLGQLCRVMQDPGASLDYRRNANAVLKVRAPHLAVDSL